MKRLICLLTLISALFVSQNLMAQNKDSDDFHKDRREKYRAEKIAFLTDKLDLSPMEAQKFWPVYNDLQEKIWEIQSNRRELEHQVREAEETMTEKEVIKLTRDFASNLQKESSLYAEYNEKFLKVLPPHKVLHLYNAENEFRKHMIKKFRDRHRNNDSE